jgi:hypothetical protein
MTARSPFASFPAIGNSCAVPPAAATITLAIVRGRSSFRLATLLPPATETTGANTWHSSSRPPSA